MKFLGIILILLLLSFCTQRETETAFLPNEQIELNDDWYLWLPLAMLVPGENPIWFEFTPNGTQLIESPYEAALTPLSPWPHARYISSMTEWNGNIVMAVNTDGFLILSGSNEGEINILYEVKDERFWHPYTVESLFLWEDSPAVLLYRNDFFTYELPPPLESQIFILEGNSPVPVPLKLPALEVFNQEEQWEAEVIHRGEDGNWYYRLREKNSEMAENTYFRTHDLNISGTRITDEEWRNSIPYLDIYDALPVNFSLPALPENFIYTGIGITGNVLAASWEEQDLPAIGAAGFMVVRLDLE